MVTIIIETTRATVITVARGNLFFSPSVDRELDELTSFFKLVVPKSKPLPNFKFKNWEFFLSKCEPPESWALDVIKNGANITLSSEPTINDPTLFRKLNKKDAIAALKRIKKFWLQGKILGPFSKFVRVHPISKKILIFHPSLTLPKKDSFERRWVMNCSYDDQGDSLNSKITDYTVAFVTIIAAVSGLIGMTFLWKADFESAFKQVLLAPQFQHLVALLIEDFIFIDVTIAMGLRPSSMIFEKLVKALLRGLIARHPDLFLEQDRLLIESYLDDIFGFSETRERAWEQFRTFVFWATILERRLSLPN